MSDIFSPSLPAVLENGAILPTRGTKHAAGLDLYALEDILLTTTQKLVRTGVHMKIPEGFYGSIRSRSSLAYKFGVCTEAGVIDEDYLGPIGVVMYCLNGTYEIKAGDRIAQLIIQPYSKVNPVEVESLESTDRGEGGFGSTGK